MSNNLLSTAVWESDCNLTSNEQFFRNVMIIAWTRYSRRSSDHFVRDQHAELDLYSANSMKQQFAGRDIAPLKHIILIPSANQFLL